MSEPPERLDVKPIDAYVVDSLVRLQTQPHKIHKAFYYTSAEWLYGGLLHVCFNLICHASCLDNVRPLFQLVHSITRNSDLRFMLRTTNYNAEMPVHTITNRTRGRANASYVLYRMCMHDSRMYIKSVQHSWLCLRMYACKRAHARRFRPCLDDIVGRTWAVSCPASASSRIQIVAR